MSRNLISFKDVTIAYLTRGIEGIRGEHQRGASDATLIRAFNELQDNGQDVVEFWDYLQANCEVELQGSSGTRGRAAPQVGETRSYRAQQVGEADPFVRIPVGSTLGVAKTGEVQATFNEDGSVTLRPVQ